LGGHLGPKPASSPTVDEALRLVNGRPLGFAEVRRLDSLPPHHSDPFDRMLVAHALEDGATIVTGDPDIARYQVPIAW
jgi:PIN domain nuclease of toxin-antitoxin system